MSKVIIAGSRTISDYELVEKIVLESDFVISEIVSGKAPGVDTLGERYAYEYVIPVKQFPADWVRHGKKAGPIRNEDMANYADAAILIWDGKSPGTKNMLEHMKRLKKPYKMVNINGPATLF